MKYRYHTRPYVHQVRALKKLLHSYQSYGGALLMEPRTGKTKVAIDFASVQNMRGTVRRVLVVAPLSALDVWKAEIRKHADPARVRGIIVWDKDARYALPRLPDHRSTRLLFVVVNYDAFSHPATRKRWIKELKRWCPDLLICDESHRVKSAGAKKTRALITIAKEIPHRIIMTGTPFTKARRPFDVYAQWKILNPARFADVGRTSAEFKTYFGEWTNRRGYPELLRLRNLDVLRKKVEQDAFSVKRKDCFDLPPRSTQIVPVDLHESRPHYDEMAEQMITELEKGEYASANIPLTKRLRLAQLTSGLARTDPTEINPKPRWYRVGKEKMTVCLDLLNDLIEADEKVVVVARWRRELDVLQEVMGGQVPTWLIRGGVPRRQRAEAIRSFSAAPGAAVLGVQPAAAGLAIDLSAASVMVWLSLTESYVDFIQTNDRIALSDRPTSYIYLLARKTIDEVMFHALRHDEDVVEMLTHRPSALVESTVLP